MLTCDLINNIVLMFNVASSMGMQVLDESSQVFFNFINTLDSDSTKESCRFCLEKFLNH